MIFSGKLGTAFFVPFKNKNISYFQGVLKQAQFLSEAEGKGDQKIVKGNTEKWCTIGILFNPAIDINKKDYILSK
jgi:hypothetical protein